MTELLNLIHAHLPSKTQLVAVAFRKDGSEAVALLHGDQPERWTVATYAVGLGRVDSHHYGPDIAGVQSSCTKFIELAAGCVREYPSWYTPAPPYRAED